MQKKQLTLVIVSLLVVVLSVSLAYFTAQIIGKGKDVTINSADLKIIFTDSDGSISGSNIEPGKWNVTKTFTIENKSNETYKYNIVIQDLVNNFVTEGYLQYKITSTDGGYNMTEFKDVPKSSVATDTILAYSVSIPVGVTQSYTVEFKYSNDESVDQSEDMGKTLSGKLFITEGTEDIYAGYEKGTLGYQIMGDNPTRNTRDTYDAVFTNNTTGTLFTATEKNVHNTTDTTVYYYAGNTTNNWVKFGIFASDGPIRGYDSANSTSFKEYTTLEECNSASSYNTNCSYAWKKGDPMYWRIIRTNADGSVRLLYSGTSYDITEGYIGKSKFTKTIKDPMYVGYKYGTSGTLESNRTNENDSTIKTYIDTWYQNNLIVYTKYLSSNAVYCNDRELKSGEKYSTTSFFYASDERISTNKQPTYNCTNMRDAFSINNTEAKLTYPIALMTADEVSYAGGQVSTKLTAPYAWYYTNANGESITGSNLTWSLTPYYLGMFGVSVWGVHGSDSPGSLVQALVGNLAVVRPAISLKSCVKYSSGDGTAGNPYTIKETTSGC